MRLFVFLAFRLAAGARADTYHFITYGTPGYESKTERIANSAVLAGRFNYTRVYGPDDLDDAFRQRNAKIIAGRESGFWVWKPYIILRHLTETVNAGEYMCYFDSDYEFKQDFRPYVRLWTSNSPHIGLTQNKPSEPKTDENNAEIFFAKRDAFVIMGINQTRHGRTQQAWCGSICFKKTFMAVQYVAEWLTFVQDARLVTDAPSTIERDNTEWKRYCCHDQAICSLLAKKWGIHLHFIPPEPVYNWHLYG